MVFSTFTWVSLWFYRRLNPECQCFFQNFPTELSYIAYLWQTPRPCSNSIAIRIHISKFTRRDHFIIHCFDHFWLYCILLTLWTTTELTYLYYPNAVKYLQEQYFMTAPPLQTEKNKKKARKHFFFFHISHYC